MGEMWVIYSGFQMRGSERKGVIPELRWVWVVLGWMCYGAVATGCKAYSTMREEWGTCGGIKCKLGDTLGQASVEDYGDSENPRCWRFFTMACLLLLDVSRSAQ